ncbi:Solute carrier family 2, facilitated glucose transporter member 1 [Gryllus bimaculatus]|nr:Solute carrier family 2, facilitated glucose transporter member 1 [Gryllus bimaculatus]
MRTASARRFDRRYSLTCIRGRLARGAGSPAVHARTSRRQGATLASRSPPPPPPRLRRSRPGASGLSRHHRLRRHAEELVEFLHEQRVPGHGEEPGEGVAEGAEPRGLHRTQAAWGKVQGWTPLLVIIGMVSILGSSVPVGYNIGVMNTPAHIIREFCNATVFETYGINMSPAGMNVLWSSIVSIFIVGGIIGSLCGGWVADLVGRRGAVIVNHALALMAAILFGSSRSAGSVEMLLLARLIVGLSSGLVTTTVPMYLTEIAPISIRGAMGVLTPLGLTVGVLLGQIMGLRPVLGREDTWHLLLSLYAIPVLLASIAIPLLPESPKYLYAIRGEIERAVDELCRLRKVSIPDELGTELEELSQSSVASAGTSWSVTRVLKTSQLYLPLCLVCAMQAGQQFSGINAVFYYSVTIFQSAGFSEEGGQYATIGAGCVNLLVTILAISLVTRFGRRALILLSCWLAAGCLILLMITIIFIDAVSWMPYLCIFAVLGYVFTYGFGLGPIPYFIGSELFDVGPRPVAMAFGSMSNWAGNFIVGMTFPSLQAYIGAYSFLIFALITICLAEFLRLYIPETQGRTAAEVADALEGGFKRRKGVMFVAPPNNDSEVGGELTRAAV